MPVHPMEMYLVKEQQLVDHGDEEFSIKVIFDGAKLKCYGLSQDSKDYCKLNQRVVGNRKEHTIVTQDWKGDGTHRHTGCCKLLKDPLRMEYSRIIDGVRKSGETLANIVQTTYVAPVLAMLAKRKVKVHPNYESDLHGGGQSVITDPMDEWLTYDMALDFFLETLKTPLQIDGQKTELNEMKDSWELIFFEHEKLRELNHARDSTLPNRDIRYLGQENREAGEIVVVCSLGHELLCTSFNHFHRNPLRIEAWQVADGKRTGGAAEACMLQGYIDHIIAKSEGQDGWYF
mmetsp:Transcript_39807/g.59338  ORF Transcript_39807/g.59338 Transcript_39807/m.59338 type:complete len:289 (+) Transcript_39807:2-868(+)